MRPNRLRVTLASLLFTCCVAIAHAAERPNVLFIAVDDLRPQLTCYGAEGMQSPNIDRLSATGVLFERAYCMVPTCGASRASLMSGVRPSPNRFVNYRARADRDAPRVTTLNTHFKHHGYHTASLGKVFHFPQDNEHGWSDPPWRPQGVPTYQLAESLRQAAEARRDPDRARRGPPYESAEVSDETYRDGQLAARAVAEIERLGSGEKPFFLAVGFFKPHLPFVAPKKYWDFYDPEKIHLPPNYHRPENAPDQAIHSFGELRSYAGVPPSGPVSDEMARRLIHGYYACVSYTDAQIGKLLDALDRFDLSENTIVVLWGDHGWNLGEHTLWCKHCTFETSMHAPLLVRAPGKGKGLKTHALTEFIDIYPSLCELAGLPLPDHLQGRSFVPLLTAPRTPWKAAAVGRYRSGDTIRTDRYRFTEYAAGSGEVVANMLYDHVKDPGENFNIAGRDGLTDEVKRLSEQLATIKGSDGPIGGAPPRSGAERPRLVVLTDIGGDPDDTQSLVRLLTHANELEIEGLVASASGTPGELDKAVVRDDLIRDVVASYGQVRDNLARHANGFPTAAALEKVIRRGNPHRGVKNVGEGKDTDGSRWIISVVDRDDPRPVCVAIWGGSTELAQALWRVREDRDAAGLERFVSKLRVHAITHQDDTGPWIVENFPKLRYVLNRQSEGEDKRESSFRGMYLGGDQALTSREWIDANVRTGHGPLGAKYPPRTWTAPNPHSALKEGDTPSWFFFLRNGLNDSEHPEWGGWGGRFERVAGGRSLYRDAKDTVGDVTHARATVWRWRPAFQRQFQSRMDWCVKPWSEANHSPRAMLGNDASRDIVRVQASPGSTVRLDASQSSDPDGDRLTYRWWIYREPSTKPGALRLENSRRARARIHIGDAHGEGTGHIILEVTDQGEPALTSYRRLVVDVAK